MRQCTATRANGQRCKAQVLTEGDLCFIHNPANQGRIEEARRKGGKNKGTSARAQKRMPKEVKDIIQVVEAAMGGVLSAKITPPQAQAVASLAGAWVRLHEIGELALELEEIKAQLPPTGTAGRGW